MKKFSLRLLAIIVAVVFAPACAAQAKLVAPPARPDTPKRIDGLVEPTTARPAAGYETPEERLALIRKAMAHRTELLSKLPPPVALCKRVPDGAVKADGELSPGEWKDAMVVTDFRLTRKLTPARAKTRAMLLWDSRYLYMAFECEDVHLISTITEPDGEFWREDTVEVFIDANADEMSYVELEVSLRALLYDAALADYRPEIDWPLDLAHLDINRGIQIYHTRDTHAAVSLNGTLNNPDDTDKDWICEIAMSWADIARGTNVTRPVPKDGDVWRMGLYRIDVNKGKEGAEDEYGAWNPTTSWFHVPWLFGRVVFVE